MVKDACVEQLPPARRWYHLDSIVDMLRVVVAGGLGEGTKAKRSPELTDDRIVPFFLARWNGEENAAGGLIHLVNGPPDQSLKSLPRLRVRCRPCPQREGMQPLGERGALWPGRGPVHSGPPGGAGPPSAASSMRRADATWSSPAPVSGLGVAPPSGLALSTSNFLTSVPVNLRLCRRARARRRTAAPVTNGAA